MSESAGSTDPRPADDSHTHGVSCAQVIAEVWTLLDGECTPQAREQLLAHLELCPGCFEHVGLEKRIKGLLATKCQSEKAPEGLKERLRLEIRRTTIIRGGQ